MMRPETKGTRGPRSPRAGIAVALIIALVLLQIIVVSMVAAGSRDRALAVHRAESLRAFYAADAGLAMSLRELSVGVDEDGDGTIGSVSSDGSAETGPRLLGSRISTVLLPTGPTSGEIAARSTATQAARGVRAAYSLGPPPGGGGGAGLAAEYFAVGHALSSLADVNWNAASSATGPVPYISFREISDSGNPFWTSGPVTQYGVRLTGRIDIPQDGQWTFRVGSDDGSRILIDGVQVVQYDGTHSFGTRTGTAALTAGTHDLRVLFYENTGVHGLTLEWSGPGVATMTTVPPSAYSLDAALSPEFPPIAVTDFVHIWGDGTPDAARIDAFDAAAGPYGGTNVLNGRLVVATNSTASQRVQLSGLAQIRGRLQVGPGGDPESVVALWGGSQITGGSTARPTAAGVHRGIDPYVSMPASEGSRTYTSSFTINSNRTFQNLSVWGSGTVVTIVGDVVIRCTGSFSIGDEVDFRLAAGATLKLYVAGDVNIYNRARINFNTGDPSRCWLFMSGADRRLQLTEQAKLVAHVRNPNGALELWGNANPGSELFGTYHGRSVSMGDRTRFHADVSLLQSGGAGNRGGRSVAVGSWSLEP